MTASDRAQRDARIKQQILDLLAGGECLTRQQFIEATGVGKGIIDRLLWELFVDWKIVRHCPDRARNGRRGTLPDTYSLPKRERR